MDKFLTASLHPVLATDAKLSSHPIVQTVNNPDEITAIFDSITYDKVTIDIIIKQRVTQFYKGNKENSCFFREHRYYEC